jgi:putative endonuclease
MSRARRKDPNSLDDRRARRRSFERHGRIAEVAATFVLMLHGYRILARRYRAPGGEVDLIAVRGRRLAFVEVKWRRTLAEAEFAISDRQARRIGRAGEHWMWRHPRFRTYAVGLDAILMAPGCWPRYRKDACQHDIQT